MARRFPSPLIGVPDSAEQYEKILSFVSAAENPGYSRPWTEFVELCRTQYRNLETGEPYSKSYLDRILRTFLKLGFVDQVGDDVVLPEISQDWIEDDAYDFETFLWHSIKRSWVLQNNFPRGIEGLREVLDVVVKLTEEEARGVTRGAVREYLGSERDYEFEDNGIRGFPTVLAQMGALEKEESRYRPGPALTTFKTRLSDSDIFRQYEQRLKQEGALVKPPSDRVKRDLSKYYIYRESGGHGKERQFYEKFWKDYLSKKSRRGETHRAEMHKSSQYRDVKSERQDLFDDVLDRFSAFESHDIRGLSTDVLRRMLNSDSLPEAERVKIAAGTGIDRLSLSRMNASERPSYTFPPSFELYDWQSEAVDEWFQTGLAARKAAESGITQVVTGAGKTVMALEVIRQWLYEHPDGVVSVIVPTRVLMHQWLSELATKLNVPAEELGWAGGGHKDAFAEGRRVMVCIVNSAVKDGYLGQQLRNADTPAHLLIADECHRYTGDVFSNIFDYHRTAELGLSATPLTQNLMEPASKHDIEAADAFELTEDDELLLNQLGPVYYTLTYDRGLKRGLIPGFTINYIGFELTPAERQTYQALTRKISNALSDIRSRHGYRLDSMRGDFNQNLQVLLSDSDIATPEIADYFEYTAERRELVADAAARQGITLSLLKNTIDNEKKAIVFQERIKQLERMVAPFDKRGRNVRTDEVTDDSYRTELYDMYPELKKVDQELEKLLSDADYRPVMYHSGHSRAIWNDFSIEWFREEGFANVMLSVKALIEGVDVPSADVGIIRVSSSSVRQRLQTLGRVLRTGGDAEKHSEMYVLYARDTVDEQIFDKHDWTNELANADVKHYRWATEDGVIDGELVETDPPQREPYEEEADREIPDPVELELGDVYPGPRDGIKISIDPEGEPFESRKNSRKFITNASVKQAADFMERNGIDGRITLNDAGHMITHRSGGEFIYLGRLDGGVDSIEYGEETGRLSEDAPTSLEELWDE